VPRAASTGWEARLSESDRPDDLFSIIRPFDCGIDAFDDAKLKRAASGWPAMSLGTTNVEARDVRPVIGRIRFAGPAPWRRRAQHGTPGGSQHPQAPLSMRWNRPASRFTCGARASPVWSRSCELHRETYEGPSTFRSTQ